MMGSLGSYLKNERETRQLTLAEIAQTTRIPVRILSQIESDQFDQLPAEVFVRGFLRVYARELGLDEGQVLERYGRSRASDLNLSMPLPNITAPESGRSFGIAIALVILLILFTLALSIVLRPRYRSAPVELSWISAPAGSETASAADTPSDAFSNTSPIANM
jgi:cytoskeletal protein RodZ